VLCYLEGKTNAEAARSLGRPVGSMSKLLSRGLALLRARLRGRGIPVPAGGAVALLPGGFPAVPEALSQTTIQAATLLAPGKRGAAAAAPAPGPTLVEGLCGDMFPKPLKLTALVALPVAALATGAALPAYHALAADPPERALSAAPEPRPVVTPARTL